MDHTTRAIDVLRQAESSLREIVANAAAAGNYEAVVQIASWASTIREISGKTTAGKHAPGVRSNAVAALPKRKPPRAKRENGYPKFFRKGDELIRVAWSRREKSEYQHKTSHAVLQAVAAAIAKNGSDGRLFSTDDCLPVRDPAGDGDIPSYQAYVVIALLKQSGLIEQHGRKGYSVPQDAELTDAVNAVWKNLPIK